MFDRRTMVGSGIALAVASSASVKATQMGNGMYGLIVKIKAVSGKRSELVAILLGGTGAMPGNLAHIVAEDMADPDGIWISEVWTDRDAHAASLKLPAVQAAIGKGRSLIAGFEDRHELRPVGGSGIKPAA